MLPKVNRLRAQRDFKRTLSGQRLASGPFFVVYGLFPLSGATPHNENPLVGFVISKKVHKRAVVRNRLKRQFREIFRHWLLNNTQASSLSAYKSIVVIVRAGSVGIDYHALEKALSRALRIPKACAS